MQLESTLTALTRIARNQTRLATQRQAALQKLAQSLQIDTGVESTPVWLFGHNAVLEALRARCRDTHALLTDSAAPAAGAFHLANIVEAAAAANCRQIPVPTAVLNAVSGGQPHQSVVLAAGKLDIPTVARLGRVSDARYDLERPGGRRGGPQRTLSTRKTPLWLALDHLSDAGNMGAILRTAWALGADGAVVPSRSAAATVPLAASAGAAKAAAGALDALCGAGRLVSAATFRRFLSDSRSNGWTVVGATLPSGLAVPVEPLSTARRQGPTLLVVGNEHSGLRPSTVALCDKLVHLPVARAGESSVDSLNVATATALFLQSFSK